MDKQNEKITELTPEQMDKVSGGASFHSIPQCCPLCGRYFDNPTEYSAHYIQDHLSNQKSEPVG